MVSSGRRDENGPNAWPRSAMCGAKRLPGLVPHPPGDNATIWRTARLRTGPRTKGLSGNNFVRFMVAITLRVMIRPKNCEVVSGQALSREPSRDVGHEGQPCLRESERALMGWSAADPSGAEEKDLRHQATNPLFTSGSISAGVSNRPTRQEPFVVTAFMRSFAKSRCTAPMNRGTTNGLGEGLQ